MTVLGIYSWTQFWSMGKRRGAESFYLSLHAFIKHGHALHVVAPREKDQPKEETLDGIQIHRFSATLGFVPDPHRQPRFLRVIERILKYVGFQIVGTWTAYRLARKIRPDAVVAYGPFAVPAARCVARRMGVPNVTRLFGQWLSICVGRRLKYYGNFPEIFAMKIPSAAIILHDDGSNGDEMARLHRVPPERFFYWKNGVDPGLSRANLDTDAVRSELGFGPDEILLFGVARLSKEKHLERALLALPHLLAEEPRIRLFLVGDGPQRKDFESLARDLGIEGAVKFVGAQPREDLYKYFNTGDIFLSVADRTNGGNPTVEAMYCGRCVVALNTGGTAKLVQDGKTGLLVDPDQPDQLPQKILQVVRDQELRRRLGEAARQWIVPQVPTIEERQRMEVLVVQRAVSGRSGEPTGGKGIPTEATGAGR
jgi:glycosyltransferase involved in cell wall biosynthesis